MSQEASEQVLDLVVKFILSQTGLALQGARRGRVRVFLEERAWLHRFDTVEGYVQWLMSLGPGTEEVVALVDLVANGLTAFWRDPGQLEAIRQALHRCRRPGGDPLALWSAGCATGEEAYTLKMLALEEGIEVTILGTDINLIALEHARLGEFSPWSVRRLDQGRIARHLMPQGPDLLAPRPKVREHVYFRRHNILDPPPRAPTSRGWDMIVCRNVMIYLTGEGVARGVDHFAGALAFGGALCLGASEQLHDPLGRLNPVQAEGGGGVLYWRQGAEGQGLEGEVSEVEDLSASAWGGSVEEGLAQALDALDGGQWHKAIDLLGVLTARDPFVADAHYLLALAYEEVAAHQNGRHALERTVFLRPEQALALFRLGSFWEARGHRVRAATWYKRAVEVLERGGMAMFETEVVSRRRELSVRGQLQLLQEARAGGQRVRMRP